MQQEGGCRSNRPTCFSPTCFSHRRMGHTKHRIGHCEQMS